MANWTNEQSIYKPFQSSIPPQETAGQLTKGFLLALNPKTQLPTIPPLMYIFQYNPNKMEDTKNVNYSITDIPGEHRPLIYYSNGGTREIKFTLMINAYETNTGVSSFLDIPGLSGISLELAKLMCFLYPNILDDTQAADTLFSSVKGLLGTPDKKIYDLTGNVAGPEDNNQFTPPPMCLFGYGAAILQCVVKAMPVKISMWNRYLDPIRAEVGVDLIVDERSMYSNVANYARWSKAMTGTALDGLKGIGNTIASAMR